MPNDFPNNSYDALIIGAGMAGLTAARDLAEAGQRVLVVEAQDRIGGRILTRQINGRPVELGAEFIHGKPPELWALIDEAGLGTYERDGSQMCFEDGKLSECPESRDRIFSILEGLKDPTGPDLSFAEYLERQSITPEERARIIGFVEGFNAADHHQISAQSLGAQQHAEDSIDGDRAFALSGGYSQLPDFLAARIIAVGAEIRQNTSVRAIHWKAGQVEVVTDTASFFATRAVITLPLGVLQAGSVPFTPPLPELQQSLQQLRMGHVQRFTLTFSKRFWADLPNQAAAAKLSFLFSPEEMPPVWWAAHPSDSQTLTGWIGGPRSDALSADGLVTHALTTLARLFSIDVNDLRDLLLSCDHHDWQADPWALGAYSYVAAGGMDAPRKLSEPIESTLFFAGEHTDTTGHWGTVHAAIRSGQRAAAQVLSAVNIDKRTPGA